MKMIRRCVGIAWFLWAGVVAFLVGGCASSKQMRTQADDHYRLAQSYLSNESPLLAEQQIRGLSADERVVSSSPEHLSPG